MVERIHLLLRLARHAFFFPLLFFLFFFIPSLNIHAV